MNDKKREKSKDGIKKTATVIRVVVGIILFMVGVIIIGVFGWLGVSIGNWIGL